MKTLKCSSGHAECSFDNPTGNISPKVRKLFAHSPTIRTTFFFQKKFFSKSTSTHTNCCFDNPAKIFSAKIWFCAQNLKTLKFLTKLFKLICSSGRVECNFAILTALPSFLVCFCKKIGFSKKLYFPRNG